MSLGLSLTQERLRAWTKDHVVPRSKHWSPRLHILYERYYINTRWAMAKVQAAVSLNPKKYNLQ